MAPDLSHEVTNLLMRLKLGDKAASDRLFQIVYGELRRLAGAYMARERSDHTLQPTALVHEVFLKLVGQQNLTLKDRAHFFGVAANMMRRVLIDHARAHQRIRRGGSRKRVTLEDAFVFVPEKSAELISLDEALLRLESFDPRQGKIVELRFFGGFSVEETADLLEIAPRTVEREWSIARAWLYMELNRNRDEREGAASGGEILN